MGEVGDRPVVRQLVRVRERVPRVVRVTIDFIRFDGIEALGLADLEPCAHDREQHVESADVQPLRTLPVAVLLATHGEREGTRIGSVGLECANVHVTDHGCSACMECSHDTGRVVLGIDVVDNGWTSGELRPIDVHEAHVLAVVEVKFVVDHPMPRHSQRRRPPRVRPSGGRRLGGRRSPCRACHAARSAGLALGGGHRRDREDGNNGSRKCAVPAVAAMEIHCTPSYLRRGNSTTRLCQSG